MTCPLTSESDPCPRNRNRKNPANTIATCATDAMNTHAAPNASATATIIRRGP